MNDGEQPNYGKLNSTCYQNGTIAAIALPLRVVIGNGKYNSKKSFLSIAGSDSEDQISTVSLVKFSVL